MSKTFTYSENGISYTVTVYVGEDGGIKADVTVTEGSMDVNAIYWGDDDFTGASANLGGPLNMNGGGSQYEGERVQWDGAHALSRPGLGREGEDKETFLSEGQTLTIDLDDVGSLDEIDFIGIRATSVNGGGSIKGVSGDPEEEEPGPDPDPEPNTYDKVFFVSSFDEDNNPFGGLAILGSEPSPNPFDNPFLPEGSEGTFADYVAHFETLEGDFTTIQSIIFYTEDEDGNLEEVLTIPAPDGGFQNAEDMLAAYDEAIAGLESESNGNPENSGDTDDDPDHEFMVSWSTGTIAEYGDTDEDEPEDLEDEVSYA